MLKTVTPGEALSILYSAFGARRTEAEACPLALARGRVLAEAVEAPVTHDTCLGTLTVSSGGETVAEIPLLAGEEIPRITYGQMVLRLLKSAFLAA